MQKQAAFLEKQQALTKNISFKFNLFCQNLMFFKIFDIEKSMFVLAMKWNYLPYEHDIYMYVCAIS